LTTVGPTVLLTGFDPFGGSALNPSWIAVKALHGDQLLGHRIVAAQLPTVFGESLRVLDALLQTHQPTLAICVGQAGGRSAISIERVAINVNDAPIADNAGARPIDTPVIAGAPADFALTLPDQLVLGGHIGQQQLQRLPHLLRVQRVELLRGDHGS